MGSASGRRFIDWRHAVMAAIAAVTAGPGQADAAAPAEAVRFTPHRAIYEITLERAASGSGVVELAGRMVYELAGSACEGYTQNMRFVTRMISQDGSEQVNDLRTSSWEEGEGQRLRFNSEQHRDGKLLEATAGDARRKPQTGNITIDLTKPARKKLSISGETLFPMQHSVALITAAREGRGRLAVGLYDGSEKGTKLYNTSAWIGRTQQPPADAHFPMLAAVPSWPVSIAYFEPGSEARDALPAYELSFRIHANGVSTGMVIDYGEFAVRGELKELKLSPENPCTPRPALKGVTPRG